MTAIAATPAHAADRVDRITAGLRQSPLFVDPDVSYLLDARQRTTIDKQLRTAGVPIYLAVVPLLSADESAGDGEYLGSLLHQRLGRNGIYLVADQRGELDAMAYQVPRDTTLDFDLATSDEPLPKKLHDAIDAFAHAPKAEAVRPRHAPSARVDERQRKTTAVGLAGEFVKTFSPPCCSSALALALLWLHRPDRRRGCSAAVRGTGRRAGPRRLRRTAEAELVRLARAIGAAGEATPGTAGRWPTTTPPSCCTTRRTTRAARFGVVVLALEGQDALREETADPAPRCVVDPFHGTAAEARTPAARRPARRQAAAVRRLRERPGASRPLDARDRRPEAPVLRGARALEEAPGPDH